MKTLFRLNKLIKKKYDPFNKARVHEAIVFSLWFFNCDLTPIESITDNLDRDT
jgi:hypothetical protein